MNEKIALNKKFVIVLTDYLYDFLFIIHFLHLNLVNNIKKIVKLNKKRQSKILKLLNKPMHIKKKNLLILQ